MLNEQLSAWMDEEVHGTESERLLEGAMRQPSQQKACALCWLIGDVLRKEPSLGRDFTSQVMAAIDEEPTVLAPRFARKNERAVRRSWMPMAAAAAGAAVAVWMGLSLWSSPAQQVQTVAQAPAPSGVLVSASGRDFSGDRSYLMAHQASSIGVPMAGVAQYIRTVSDDRQVSAR